MNYSNFDSLTTVATIPASINHNACVSECECVNKHSPILTGTCCADAPCMAGSGRVPGKEAGSGCLCLFRMWRREDSGPGTGLWSATEREE